MSPVFEAVFWLSLAGCMYSYALYPLLLRLVPATPTSPETAPAGDPGRRSRS